MPCIPAQAALTECSHHLQDGQLLSRSGPSSPPISWQDNRYLGLILDLEPHIAFHVRLRQRTDVIEELLRSTALGGEGETIVETVLAGYGGQGDALRSLTEPLLDAAALMLSPDQVASFRREFQAAAESSALQQLALDLMKAQVRSCSGNK